MFHGREPGSIRVHHARPIIFQLFESCLHVDCVPEHHHIYDEAQAAKLVFLTLSVRVTDFSATAVERCSCQAMSAFSAVELRKNSTAIRFIVDIVELEKCF